jgi:iron complex transport system ATP-binding protein
VSRIEAAGIRAGYRARSVLHDVEIAARDGELVALIGPNGAGKSTVLRVLAGLLRPSAGEVRIDGRRIAGLPRSEVGRLVAVVPQVFETLFPFTVREVVALGRTSRVGLLGIFGAEDARAVKRAIDDLALRDLADRRIDRLSGGERQRAVLAMALAQESQVLLLDEPTAHLDPAHQRATLEHTARIAKERGLAVIAVLHDLNLASALASRVVVLREGAVMRDGDPREVLTPALVAEVFGAGLSVVMHGGRPYVLPVPDETNPAFAPTARAARRVAGASSPSSPRPERTSPNPMR